MTIRRFLEFCCHNMTFVISEGKTSESVYPYPAMALRKAVSCFSTKAQMLRGSPLDSEGMKCLVHIPKSGLLLFKSTETSNDKLFHVEFSQRV